MAKVEEEVRAVPRSIWSLCRKQQVSTLLYTMGEEAEDILMSTKISYTDKKVYDKVIEKFDLFFQVRKKRDFRESHI